MLVESVLYANSYMLTELAPSLLSSDLCSLNMPAVPNNLRFVGEHRYTMMVHSSSW